MFAKGKNNNDDMCSQKIDLQIGKVLLRTFFCFSSLNSKANLFTFQVFPFFFLVFCFIMIILLCSRIKLGFEIHEIQVSCFYLISIEIQNKCI